MRNQSNSMYMIKYEKLEVGIDTLFNFDLFEFKLF